MKTPPLAEPLFKQYPNIAEFTAKSRINPPLDFRSKDDLTKPQVRVPKFTAKSRTNLLYDFRNESGWKNVESRIQVKVEAETRMTALRLLPGKIRTEKAGHAARSNSAEKTADCYGLC